MPQRPAIHRTPRSTAPVHRAKPAKPEWKDRLYGRRWKAASKAHLAEHPLCVECDRRGLVVAAEVVDHIVPHMGDETLFWDSATNWRSLCKQCHDQATVKHDGGFGRPVTPKPTPPTV